MLEADASFPGAWVGVLRKEVAVGGKSLRPSLFFIERFQEKWAVSDSVVRRFSVRKRDKQRNRQRWRTRRKASVTRATSLSTIEA